jgi:exopolysaccharide biosynthesis polyprenyl glycosylphosphotransferase
LEPIPDRLSGWMGLSDGGAFLIAFLATPLVAAGHPVSPLNLLAVFLVTASTFGLCGLYSPRTIGTGWSQAGRLVRASLFVLVLFGILVLGESRHVPPSVLTLAVGGLLISGLVRTGVWRPWLRRAYGSALSGARVIVGTGHLARRIAEASSEKPGTQPRLVGFVDDLGGTAYQRETLKDLPAPFLGGLDLVQALARERRITHVLVAREDLSRRHLVELAHSWMNDRLHVSLVSSAFEVMVARASASMLGGVPLANLQPSPQRGWKLRLKRTVDVAVALVGGILVFPVLLLVALAIKLTSPGPTLFKQQRVGRNGREFTFYKFRSMYADTDDRAHREYAEALMRGEPAGVNVRGEKVYKLIDDPRVTPIGRFIRAASFDEFPQLWNVIRGDMSLVGPRPCLPYEWELYEEWQRPRLSVLPGITGLWQVSGRSQVPFEEMVLLDLHYIANWSPSLDFRLLVKTIPVVLNGSGGH